MVELAVAPTVAVGEAPIPAWLGDNAVTDASIARYLSAGERMQTLSDVTWKVCVGLFVLVAIAWALGVLPAAIKLF